MQQMQQRSIFCQGQDDWWWLILKWCNMESEASQPQWEGQSGSLQNKAETPYELLFSPQKNLIRNIPSEFNSFDQIPKKAEGLKHYAKQSLSHGENKTTAHMNIMNLNTLHKQTICRTLHACVQVVEPKNIILTHTSSRVPSFSPRKLEAGATIKGIDHTPGN